MEITECFGKNRHGEKGLIVTKLISDKCALEDQIKHVILSLSKYEHSSFKSEEYKTLVRERVKLELKYKRVLAELQKYDDKKSISEIELK